MRTLQLPGGDTVPVLGQGTWFMGEDASARAEEIRALQTGVDLGLALIDTAEVYGNGRAEELVGEAIAGRRDDVFIVSKVLPSNASRKGTVEACERSLKRLKTDVIDMYLLHWQGAYPFMETIAGMMNLLEAGKIRHWGVSNMDVAEMDDIFSFAEGRSCAVNQILYNLSRRGVEYDLLPWCTGERLAVMAYSPVEQGRILENQTLCAIAERHNATPARIALAWVLENPRLMAIPKAGKAEHVRENSKCLEIVFTPEDLRELDAAFPPPKRKEPLEML